MMLTQTHERSDATHRHMNSVTLLTDAVNESDAAQGCVNILIRLTDVRANNEHGSWMCEHSDCAALTDM